MFAVKCLNYQVLLITTILLAECFAKHILVGIHPHILHVPKELKAELKLYDELAKFVKSRKIHPIVKRELEDVKEDDEKLVDELSRLPAEVTEEEEEPVPAEIYNFPVVVPPPAPVKEPPPPPPPPLKEPPPPAPVKEPPKEPPPPPPPIFEWSKKISSHLALDGDLYTDIKLAKPVLNYLKAAEKAKIPIPEKFEFLPGGFFGAFKEEEKKEEEKKEEEKKEEEKGKEEEKKPPPPSPFVTGTRWALYFGNAVTHALSGILGTAQNILKPFAKPPEKTAAFFFKSKYN